MNAASPSIPTLQTASSPLELRAELVRRARELLPLIAANAARTERERRAAEENIQAMAAAGLFRMTTPKRHGGLEVDFRTSMEVTSVIAEACGGTAWVLNLCNVCAWFVGLFSERTQNEVFGENPDARVAGVLAPAGQVRRVDGGLVVSGKWYYSSGSLHADWGLIGLLETGPDGEPIDQYLALVPIKDMQIEDTWFTVGMRGSGSNCLVANEVFIPDHRLASTLDAIEGEYPTEHKEEALYRSAFVPVGALVLTAPQLGLARAALQYVIDMAPRKAIAYTRVKRQCDSTAFQLQIAEAAMKIETAHLHAYRAADDIDDFARRAGQYMDYKSRARVRADSAVVVKQVTEALQILLFAHGAGSFGESSILQRIWRDSNTAARHAVILPAVSEEVYGKALLGIENDLTALV